MIRILSMLLAASLVLAASGAAALEIRVRGEAVIDVDVSAAGTVAQVSGTLRDDLGRGLPQRELLVQIDARRTGQTLLSRKIRTDARGIFGVQEELPPGRYEVFVRFDETEHLDAIAHSESVLLEPRPVEVRAYAPRMIYGGGYDGIVSARATAGDVPYQGEGDVLVDDDSVGQMEFDATGRGTFDVLPYLSVGMNEVTVRTPGSAYREASEARVDVRFSDDVTITASIDEQLQRLQRGLAVSGRVYDSFGPLEGVRVRTRVTAVRRVDREGAAGEFTATGVTDEDGRFVGFVPSSKLTDGVWRGEAAFVPPIGDSITADAGVTEIDTRAYRWAVNGFGLTAILFGLLVLLARVGQVFWERWLEMRRRRERAARERRALEDVEEIVPVFFEPDEEMSDVERSRHDVGGVVWDVWKEQPVPEAHIELRHDNGERLETQAEGTGRFRFVDLTPGTWRMEVTSYGFIPGRLQFDVPHDGKLSYFRVDVVAVPLKIRRLYGAIVEQSTGENLWGRLSPRQIERRLESRWPGASDVDRRRLREAVLSKLRAYEGEHDLPAVLAALTEVVEESYFSGRRYGEPAFRFARALALDVRARTVEEER